KEEDPQQRLNYQLHLAELYKDQKDLKSSLSSYKKALYLQNTIECKEKCSENTTRLRKYVLDWHKAEKRQPSQALISAYEQYLEFFPNEVDMALWRFDILKANKSWSKAISAIDRIVEVYEKGLASKGRNNKSPLPDIENILLMQVEIAEMSRNENLMKDSYVMYLTKSKKLSKKIDISYQLAHLSYKNKEYKKASEEFKAIVFMPEAVNSHIRIKAADLALDTIVLLKDDKLLEDWALEFSKAIPTKAIEYKSIARKSIFNQTSQLVSNSHDEAWATLNRIDLSNANEDEKLLYFKNKLVLAEKLHKYTEARDAVSSLLQFKNLSKKDYQWVLSRQAWLAEMALDFSTALKVTQKINLEPYVPKAKNLKLALFAELSGENADTYYKKYIVSSQDKDQQVAVALKLVESSQDALLSLDKYKKYLINKPDLYTSKVVEYLAYKTSVEQKFSTSWFNKLSKDKNLNTTPSFIFMWKHNFILDTQELVSKIESHRINTQTQKKLANSLNYRIQLLDKLEKSFNDSVSKGDWTAQLYSLHHLARQSQKLYDELLSLPLPEGLTPEQQMQYMQLLSQQAAPFHLKAQELAKKEPEFWKSENVISDLEARYKDSLKVLRPFIKNELNVLYSIASDEIKMQLTPILEYTFPEKVQPNLVELERARDQVRNQPLDIVNLDNLIELEKKIDNKNMVSYLMNRRQQIQELKGEKQ
ncbi:MAG: hypothetical protein KDD58_15320, partial [Bdellovibrionales bacterium]|nr:hypothetical protein [Bdellovibrionales bacterium]